jgi:hypothetical protein
MISRTHNGCNGPQSPDGKPAIEDKQILCLPIEAASEMGNRRWSENQLLPLGVTWAGNGAVSEHVLRARGVNSVAVGSPDNNKPEENIL